MNDTWIISRMRRKFRPIIHKFSFFFLLHILAQILSTMYAVLGRTHVVKIYCILRLSYTWLLMSCLVCESCSMQYFWLQSISFIRLRLSILGVGLACECEWKSPFFFNHKPPPIFNRSESLCNLGKFNKMIFHARLNAFHVHSSFSPTSAQIKKRIESRPFRDLHDSSVSGLVISDAKMPNFF